MGGICGEVDEVASTGDVGLKGGEYEVEVDWPLIMNDMCDCFGEFAVRGCADAEMRLRKVGFDKLDIGLREVGGQALALVASNLMFAGILGSVEAPDLVHGGIIDQSVQKI